MVKIYSKVILNSEAFLRFEICNSINWTKVYLNMNNKEIYLGAEEYNCLVSKFNKSLFNSEYEELHVVDDQKIFMIAILSEKHNGLYRSLLNDDYFYLYVLNSQMIFTNKIKVELKKLKFE